MKFKQVSIIGTGLIGGSLGLALRRRGIARRVIGFSRSEKTIRRAIARGAIHEGDTELCANWLGESDLVVLAVPPEEVVPMARRIARMTRHSFLMTDMTSVKGPIVGRLDKILPSRIRFVGSHPMAGSERSGIEAADAGLFRGAACVVTRTARTDPAALRRIGRMWRAVDAEVIVMDPRRHDRLVAQISHVPHLTAAALTLFPETAAMPLAGGGFADLTRVAESDPEMWDQICRMNRKEILAALNRLTAGLVKVRAAVARRSVRAALQLAHSRRSQFK